MKQAGPITELFAYRELLWMLAWRDIRVRYKHTVLGAAWAVAPPLLTMLIFVLVFRYALKVGNLTGDTGLPYPLFALIGLVPWTFFTSGLTGSVQSLVANRPLLTKIAFPREVFPLSAVLSAAVDFLVALGVLAAVVAYFHFATAWSVAFDARLLLLPVVILVQVVLMAGLAFLLSMGHLFYRDVGHVVRALLPLMMFVTNVVYPLKTANPTFNLLIHLNPMVPILDAYRAALAPASPFPTTGLAYAGAVAAFLLVGGWTLFHRSEYEFAERV
ncbi:MAG: ABC transporter permease [Phycisphaerae bacterium]